MPFAAFFALERAQQLVECLFLLLGMFPDPVVVEMLGLFESLGANVAYESGAHVIIVVRLRGESLHSFVIFSVMPVQVFLFRECAIAVCALNSAHGCPSAKISIYLLVLVAYSIFLRSVILWILDRCF